MICQKLNYSPIRTYSQYPDWDFVDPVEPDSVGAVSCDSVSDVAVFGLLNWQADGMLQRLQCCVVRRNESTGFGRQVKYHTDNRQRSFEWPRYYEFFYNVTIQISKKSGYHVYGTLKAHLDVISFSMFTFLPHERRAVGGVAKWVLNDRRLQALGIDDAICSVNNVLRVMSNFAFGYPMHLGYLESGNSNARSYAEMLILASGR